MVRHATVLLLLLAAGCANVAPDSQVSRLLPGAAPATASLDMNAPEARIRATKAIAIWGLLSDQNKFANL